MWGCLVIKQTKDGVRSIITWSSMEKHGLALWQSDTGILLILCLISSAMTTFVLVGYCVMDWCLHIPNIMSSFFCQPARFVLFQFFTFLYFSHKKMLLSWDKCLTTITNRTYKYEKYMLALIKEVCFSIFNVIRADTHGKQSEFDLACISQWVSTTGSNLTFSFWPLPPKPVIIHLWSRSNK